MQIDKLEIENFKLFAKQKFTFHPQFNLVIGENGSGKTSLLKALAVALGGWAHAYIKDKKNLRSIAKDEIREIQIDKRFDKTRLTAINASGVATIVDNDSQQKEIYASWSRECRDGGRTFTKGFVEFHNNLHPYDFDSLGSNILGYIEKGKKFNLPLIAVYECDRLWLPQKKINLESAAKAQYSHFDPYIDCFHIGLNDNENAKWLIKNELASLQQGKENSVLQSIRNAAKAALEKCSSIRFDIDQSRIIVEFTDGRSIPFEHLSDGQRTILGLFCDIARRAAILNPHLAGNASAETKGVVLIDELDLHLHPAWQQSIVGNLKKAFPNIQFFATTHSPQIVSTVPSDQILILDEGKVYSAPAGTQGAESSRILERIFLIKLRPPNDPNVKLLNEYVDLVYSDKWIRNDEMCNEARKKRVKLDAIYQGNEPALKKADLYIDNRKWELEIEENQ